MSLESKIDHILGLRGVQRVSFTDSTGEIEVIYSSRPFFRNWSYGPGYGSHAEREEYFQDHLDVTWSLKEVQSGTPFGDSDSQVAVFTR
jgi:hypothetical protein